MNKKIEGDIPPQTLRIIDANLNRLREGLRVVEDVCRYGKNDKELSATCKALRHRSRVEDFRSLLASRDIIGDPSKNTTPSEQTRADLDAVLFSNLKRAQESSRVLEEVWKLFDTHKAENFKLIRYDLYKLEQDMFL